MKIIHSQNLWFIKKIAVAKDHRHSYIGGKLNQVLWRLIAAEGATRTWAEIGVSTPGKVIQEGGIPIHEVVAPQIDTELLIETRCIVLYGTAGGNINTTSSIIKRSVSNDERTRPYIDAIRSII